MHRPWIAAYSAKPVIFAWLTSAFLLLLSTSDAVALPPCREAFTEASHQTSRQSCEKPWLILIHMAADNDLAPYALLDLHELQSIGTTVQADIVVQLDLPGPGGVKTILVRKSPGGFDSSLGPESFENTLLDSRFSYREIHEVPEPTRMGEERKLRDFLVRGSRLFPARHTLVTVWGHGRGWTSLTLPHARSRPGGMGFSESSGRFLGIPALKRALMDSAAEARGGRPWDLFLADACLMQMAEVVTELSPAARFLLGSSQNQDYLGVPYRKLLELLNSRSSRSSASIPDPAEIAGRLPDLMRSFLEKRSRTRGASSEDLDMGMSSVHSEEWEQVFLPSFRRFTSALLLEASADDRLRIQLKRIVRETERFESGGVELGTWLRALDMVLRDGGFQSTHGPRLLLARTIQSLDRSVLAYSVSSPSLPLGKRSISLWVPSHADEYRARAADFSKSGLHRSTDVSALLKLLSR